jgi:hypothetical protein
MTAQYVLHFDPDAPYAGTIYGFRAPESDEIRYVGMTSTTLSKRLRQHLKRARSGAKTPFYDWLRKQDPDNVQMQPIEPVRGALADLAQAERNWIAILRAQGHRLLNLTDGGLGPNGHVWTAEQRAAAGDRARGRPTGVHRFGADNPAWGMRHSDEQRARWSELRKGTNTGAANPNYGKFGPDHPSFGRTVSEETRRLLSEQKRGALNPNFGKSASEETRAKMSAVRKGRPMPSSRRNAHTRHHTNKGVFKEECQYCLDDRNKESENS